MSKRFFHTTAHAREILSAGFQDHAGYYGLATTELVGVFLAVAPASESDGAEGSDVLAVDLPDDLDLDLFAIVEDGHPVWEWCVPAELLNTTASLRLAQRDRG